MHGHTKEVNGVAFFNYSRRVVTGSLDSTVRIWDIQKGALAGKPFEGHQGRVRSVAVSPDDRQVASGGLDKIIIIWDVESHRNVKLKKHTDVVRSVCFSPDGKRLASGSDDRTAVVWNVETRAVLKAFEGHPSGVLSVAFSPDALNLACGSWDKILVWRIDNAELIRTINGHQSLVRSVAWSPDGQQLVSASKDKTVKSWNSSSGLEIGEPYTGHIGRINSHAISSDGSFIATAASELNDKTVRLWSTKTHQQIGQALEHPSWVYCVAISPDGTLLASSGQDGVVYLWSIRETLKRHDEQERQKEKLEVEQQPTHVRAKVRDPPLDVRGSFSSASPRPREFTLPPLQFGPGLGDLPASFESNRMQSETKWDRVGDEVEDNNEDFFDAPTSPTTG
ncbi:WD40 repeat-like protein [Rhizopogon vinicolor AM-OR11-026]|uniref:WD40 repeat-like protein n=1 Tax=Rhizopogon vinicolor AM-OR11-026 TaxID=1314800 RepID=A0A1B7MG75_9AGAM|nr:WD40 repeat-like protein [Rhizopogon vinicolor AM-OR11-026]